MQEDQFYEFFLPKLVKLGYKCTFLKRTNADKLDGCAICFKLNKFDLIKEVPVRYCVPNIDVLNRCKKSQIFSFSINFFILSCHNFEIKFNLKKETT
jgi:hypothetical protein